MKRRTGAALVATALVGTTGGVVFAINGAGPPSAQLSASPPATSVPKPSDAAPATPTTNPSATRKLPSPSKSYFGSGSAKANTPLLYTTDGTIHDGDTIIAINGLDQLDVISVDRFAGGYLVGAISGDETKTDFSIVDDSGSTRLLVRAFSSYDINLAKDRLVAIDAITERAVVLTGDGKVIGSTEDSLDDAIRASVGFVEDEVLILTQKDEKKQQAVRWDPRTSKTKKVDAPELLGSGVSPGGSFFAGNTTGSDGEGGCLAVRSDKRVGVQHNWRACEWRSYGTAAQFSPDGSQILAVPVLTDGFGPGELATFGVREDSDTPVGDFKTPNLTASAAWADDDHLWLVGARGGNYEFEKGYWIKKCDLDGKCETVATTDDDDTVVLGGGVY